MHVPKFSEFLTKSFQHQNKVCVPKSSRDTPLKVNVLLAGAWHFQPRGYQPCSSHTGLMNQTWVYVLCIQ